MPMFCRGAYVVIVSLSFDGWNNELVGVVKSHCRPVIYDVDCMGFSILKLCQ
jgi:hypothetical protein